MLRLIMVAIALGVGFAGAALAGETWRTDGGDVFYEADLDNGMAVLSYPLADGDNRGFALISDMAGEHTGRTKYDGVWVEPPVQSSEGCAVEMISPVTGIPTNNWGRLKLIFVDPDFPGTWVALRGACFDEPDQMLVGRPVLTVE